MLPHEQRIQREEMDKVLARGVLKHSPLFSARILKTADPHIKFSFVVSKKVANTAVLRNKLRRRGYSAVKTLSPGIDSGYSVAFFFKKGVAEVAYTVLAEEVRKFLEINGIYKKPRA
jgi:ribonuclease P protein component